MSGRRTNVTTLAALVISAAALAITIATAAELHRVADQSACVKHWAARFDGRAIAVETAAGRRFDALAAIIINTDPTDKRIDAIANRTKAFKAFNAEAAAFTRTLKQHPDVVLHCPQ